MRRIVKSKKSLIIAVLNIILIFSTLAFSTLAWYAANRKLGTYGMSVTVKVTPNMVISTKNGTAGTGNKSITEYTNKDLDKVTFTWGDSAASLQVATHDWTTGTETGLKYNNDARKIQNDTGLDSSSSGTDTLTYSPVTYDKGKDVYFIDYIVFIASVDQAYGDITGLYATIEETGNPLTTSQNIAYKATSVDFYLEEVSVNQTITAKSNTYKGTLNLAGTTSQINLFSNTTITEIPINTKHSLAVLMRCYFDGGLTYTDSESKTKAYINTEQLATNTSKVSFNISFTAQ